MFLVKNCPSCGISRVMVSSDAKRYIAKRKLSGYQGEAESTCSLKCVDCNHGKPPSLVFLDVTNRCNMNCPICLANIPAMGFTFDPSLEYFDKVFKKISQMNPRPKIELFGGEPTVRDDLVDIINLAKSYGLSARVVTNGIRLANEEYCKKLLETKAQLMFSLDGLDPEIYEKIRKNPKAYELKIKAFENLRKFKKSKVTIMCATGYGINDKHIGGLIDFCHDNRDIISALDLIPLTANWGPEQVNLQSSSTEDVEKIVEEAKPGMQFFPASLLYKFKTMKRVFDARLTFGGAHPNCESVSLMISDGRQYLPFTKFLKTSQNEALLDAIRLDEKLGEKLKKNPLVALFGNAGEKMVCGWAALKLIGKTVNLQEVFGVHSTWKIFKIILGLAFGKKLKRLLRKYSKCQNILRIMVLPFEEPDCIESARLVDCPASFAYEHPESGEIRLMPVCAWPMYKNNILRATAKKYQAGALS
ncbi:radical SAM protein [Candidatus Sumerlaeota bacterium]|nr:radical SAM protein [Candidatus Sumerlaeota bacterium]